MRKCNHPECDNDISRHYLYCRRHWFKLPKPIRDEIWRTCSERREDYTAAVRAAVEYFLDDGP